MAGNDSPRNSVRHVRQAEGHRGALRRDDDAGPARPVPRALEGAVRDPADRREVRDYKAVESARGDARELAGADPELRELAKRESRSSSRPAATIC